MNFLKVIEAMKTEALYIKNCDGENPLFIAARLGHLDIFNWFTGKIDFFRAWGERNYKGQTIEHIICEYGMHGIVQAVDPRPDTKDYMGNLPLFYSVAKNDTQMFQIQFKHSKQYFHLRNYKN